MSPSAGRRGTASPPRTVTSEKSAEQRVGGAVGMTFDNQSSRQVAWSDADLDRITRIAAEGLKTLTGGREDETKSTCILTLSPSSACGPGKMRTATTVRATASGQKPGVHMFKPEFSSPV